MAGITPLRDAAPAPRRLSRWLAAWIAFGVLGISMGAVWATGFAGIGGAQGATGESIVVPSDGATEVSDLAALISADDPLTVSWDGANGSVANTSFFAVDLSGKAGQTFNVGIKLANGPALNSAGWATLQLRLDYETDANSDCSDETFDSTTAAAESRVMVFDYADASVYFNGLAGGSDYCIGIGVSTYPGELDGANGEPVSTFIAAADRDNLPSVYPHLIATLDRVV